MKKLRFFLEKFTLLTKLLHDCWSRRSRHISSLPKLVKRVISSSSCYCHFKDELRLRFCGFCNSKKKFGPQKFCWNFSEFFRFLVQQFWKNIKQLPSLKKCSLSSCSSNFIYGHSEFLILPRAGLRIWASTQAKWWTSQEGPSEIPQHLGRQIFSAAHIAESKEWMYFPLSSPLYFISNTIYAWTEKAGPIVL